MFVTVYWIIDCKDNYWSHQSHEVRALLVALFHSQNSGILMSHTELCFCDSIASECCSKCWFL